LSYNSLKGKNLYNIWNALYSVKKIVTLGITLNDDHKKRLDALGELQVLTAPVSVDNFVQKVAGYNVILSNGEFLLDSLDRLKDVFVTYPYVELGVFDSEKLERNGVTVANSRGGNRDSIVEWVMFMLIDLFRKFRSMVRASETFEVRLQESLVNKKVLIVGHGSIGSQIGVLCKSFGMKVSYFDRGEDIRDCSKDADVIINALNCNTSSRNLLDENYFLSLKKGSYFLTFVRPHTYDLDGLIKSINAGVIAGAAIDCDPEKFGDTTNSFYQKALSCPQILVTPHIAFSTVQAVTNGREIAIQNIENYFRGHLNNIVRKS
jgi:phosphoglycerate dehydrogenase-like enzyme